MRPSLWYFSSLFILFTCIGCDTESRVAETKLLYDQLGFDVRIFDWRPEPVSKELREKIESVLADPELMKFNSIESSPNGRWEAYMLYEEKGEFAGWTNQRISSGWCGDYRSYHQTGSRLFLKNTLTGDIYDVYAGDNKLKICEDGYLVQDYGYIPAIESSFVADNGTLIYSVSYIVYPRYENPSEAPLTGHSRYKFTGSARIIADIEESKKKCIGRISDDGKLIHCPSFSFGLSQNGKRLCLDYNAGKYSIVDITDFHLVYSCERGNILGNTPDFEYVVERYLWERSDSDYVYLVKTDNKERKSLGGGDLSFWQRGDVYISPNGEYVLNDFRILIFAEGGTADEIGFYSKVGIYRDNKLFLAEFPRFPKEGAFYIYQWLDENLAESFDSDVSPKFNDIRREIDDYGNVTIPYGENSTIRFVYKDSKYVIEPPDTEGVTIREIDRAYFESMKSRVVEVID